MIRKYIEINFQNVLKPNALKKYFVVNVEVKNIMQGMVTFFIIKIINFVTFEGIFSKLRWLI